MSKKSLKQLNTLRSIVFDDRVQAYVPAKGFMVMDEDEQRVVQYISYDRSEEWWRVEYTDGSERERLRDSNPEFLVYKQVP